MSGIHCLSGYAVIQPEQIRSHPCANPIALKHQSMQKIMFMFENISLNCSGQTTILAGDTKLLVVYRHPFARCPQLIRENSCDHFYSFQKETTQYSYNYPRDIITRSESCSLCFMEVIKSIYQMRFL